MDDLSIFLAKFWGWYLLIFFFILSYNPGRVKQIFRYFKNQRFSILVAFIAIVVGLINILLHNEWTYDWPIIITLIGWVALGQGVFLFTFPIPAARILDFINVKLVQVVYVLLLLLGLFLLNAGYELLNYK